MRFPNECTADRLLHAGLLLTTALALTACGGLGDARSPASVAASMPANGPQADYPVRIGAPYMVAGTAYTPADVLNYDEVGYAAAMEGEGVTGAHHTLPVPSYVEVTSLETGRTILLRLEERGPMESTHLVALSPAAIAQLGGGAGTPVRVRRVNPAEEHRALLRMGQAAPLRMDTPMALVTVLKRRLPEAGPTSLANAPVEVQAPQAPAAAVTAAQMAETEPEEVVENFAQAFALVRDAEAAVSTATEQRAPIAAGEGFVVQAAAFSTQERADNAAVPLEGQVTRSGRFWRVRTGPFATREEAEASLAKVRAAGYSDARIYEN